jgi:predicted xylose isomerase-like sugar epimerase
VCDAVSLLKQTRHEIQPLTEKQARQLLVAERGHSLEGLLMLAVTTQSNTNSHQNNWNPVTRSLVLRKNDDRIENSLQDSKVSSQAYRGEYSFEVFWVHL